jgi:hypothetical protein
MRACMLGSTSIASIAVIHVFASCMHGMACLYYHELHACMHPCMLGSTSTASIAFIHVFASCMAWHGMAWHHVDQNPASLFLSVVPIACLALKKTTRTKRYGNKRNPCYRNYFKSNDVTVWCPSSLGIILKKTTRNHKNKQVPLTT